MMFSGKHFVTSLRLGQSTGVELMTLNVLLRYFVLEYHDAFVYLIEDKDYVDVLYLCRYTHCILSVPRCLPVIFCQSKIRTLTALTLSHKRDFTERLTLIYMFIVSCLIPLNVIRRFMSHTIETKAENYEKQFIGKFLQNLRKYSLLEMLRFFLCSIYDIDKFLMHFVTPFSKCSVNIYLLDLNRKCMLSLLSS